MVILSPKASASDNNDVPYGKTFYTDYPAAQSDPLGASQHFHIFANKAVLNAHTDGNVATGDLTGEANFGTNIHQGLVTKDVSYIQNITSISSSSFVQPSGTRSNKAVFGNSVSLWLKDQNNVSGVFVGSQSNKMGHLDPSEVFQDKVGQNQYIDFASEFAKDSQQSITWSEQKDSTGIVKNFTDMNNRFIDVSNASTGSTYSITLTKTNDEGAPLSGAVFDLYYENDTVPTQTGLTTDASGKINITNLDKTGTYYFVETKAPQGYKLDTSKQKVTVTSANGNTQGTIYYTLSAAELEQGTPIKIKGLSKNGPSLIINVDLTNASTLDVHSKIVPVIDGTERNNQETEDFSDAKLLFNFYNADNKSITIDAPFQGTILAPNSNVTANQNVDGSIIANQVNVSAETHRWDFQSSNDNSGTPAAITVINHKEDTETTNVSVTKKWDDNNNQDGIRPDSITVQLYANDEKSGTPVELSATNNWSYNWQDLPKQSNGQDIKYSVQEVGQTEGYNASYTDNGSQNIVITNHHSAEVIKISGTKTWDDQNNAQGLRPEYIVVHLLANGKEVKSQKVTAKTNWQYTFTDLPKFANGKKITYTITEDKVSHYQSEVNGYNLTNHLDPTPVTPVKPDKPVKPASNHKSDKKSTKHAELPKTMVQNIMWTSVFAVIAITVFGVTVTIKKRNKR
ncbi:Cna B-type domain-containing protein [Leuconostoc pseudomesenteroides]|uniref:Cna B-type domain-containing protein n=1 Tax=Leuconostoc pseudomesenteroides TaxID=33968 RepID=UPI001B8CBAF7|nr:Cna B-type domain-containing protein [Leuconostoc pseudomesenteroides]